MQLLAVGHKRTGACPTLDRPVLQRDGLLLRIPLVGGALTGAQAAAVAEVAASRGTGVIELTNRGNLQVRGVRDGAVVAAQAQIRAAGLGARGAALVTLSPFAGPVEHQLGEQLVAALHTDLATGPVLAPKFVVHLDDAAGWTGGRRAEAVLAPEGDRWTIQVSGLGGQTADAATVTATVRALVARCRDAGDQARVADVLALDGAARLAGHLPLDPSRWEAVAPRPVAFDGVGPLGPLGPITGPDGVRCVVAAAPLGRLGADVLAGLADLAAHEQVGLRVTPWRSIAVGAPAGAEDRIAGALGDFGLVVDVLDPAAGVVACVGAAGCWQTEADARAEAERQIALRRTGRTGAAALAVGAGVLHVSGCDKRCATRSPAAVTLVGRPDGSGFDQVPAA